MSDRHSLVADTLYEQTSSPESEAGIPVRHEDLLGRVKRQTPHRPEVFTYSGTCHQRLC